MSKHSTLSVILVLYHDLDIEGPSHSSFLTLDIDAIS
jgi:hypothetical protein